MSTTIRNISASKRNFYFRLWFDHVDFRGNDINMSDRTLRDIGLFHREALRPLGPFWN
jgi:hypothetical protein